VTWHETAAASSNSIRGDTDRLVMMMRRRRRRKTPLAGRHAIFVSSLQKDAALL